MGIFLLGQKQRIMKKSINSGSLFILFIILFCLLSVCVVEAADTTSAQDLKSYSTLYSLGIEWVITGDDNHNASCRVRFKKQGTKTWHDALPLYRVDYLPPQPTNGNTYHFNGFAGSVFFLEPGQEYDVQLDLVDPDGGSASRLETVAMHIVPKKPVNGRVYHVVPGTGSGNGSVQLPFHGIKTAQEGAQAGDVFLLHAGHYTGFDGNNEIQLNAAGDQGNYIVWQAVGGEKVVFDAPVRIAADYIWLEGVHVKGHADIQKEYGLRTYNAPKNIVISKNMFTDFYYSISINHGGENWLISDNTIIGDKDVVGEVEGPPSWRGEGIELDHTSGHTVAHNSISRVADGISYPDHNCDIFGNDIFNVTDDGIEPDYGYANIRVWGNRISNARHNGFSFQPMNGGPWYFIRNQVAAPRESSLKIRETSRVLLAHNIFVGWNNALRNFSSDGERGILTFESKNNIWITVDDNYVWARGFEDGSPSWRTSLDYDGFDWGSSEYAFRWSTGARYHTIAEFYNDTGLEEHGVHINREACFTTFQIDEKPPASMQFQYMLLKPGCNGVDGGIVLANINEHFSGNAPDLGPYELDAPLPHYGPRIVQGLGPVDPSPGTGACSVSSWLLLLLDQ